MPDLTRSQTVSRSAWMELNDELRLVNDGYEFLDEKRILLAAEMLRQRDAYREARKEFMARAVAASEALIAASEAIGLDALQVHAVEELTDARFDTSKRACIGQIMLEARLQPGPMTAPPALPEVRDCRTRHLELLIAGAELAALATNIERLTFEYRRTERRVRALENVVMPEIRSDIADMENHLELVDQEEVIRVHSSKRERAVAATADQKS